MLIAEVVLFTHTSQIWDPNMLKYHRYLHFYLGTPNWENFPFSQPLIEVSFYIRKSN